MNSPFSSPALDDATQELVSLYVAGGLDDLETQALEQRLAEDPELLRHTAHMLDVAVSALVPRLGPIQAPAARVESLVMCRLFPGERPWRHLRSLGVRNDDALVVSDAAGIIEWVSPAFTRMCGFSLEELHGRKAGVMLQGPLTDATVVGQMRRKIRAGEAVDGELVNYHKNGTPYRVFISITPIRDEEERLTGFAAVEREMSEV